MKIQKEISVFMLLLLQRSVIRVRGTYLWNKPAFYVVPFMHDPAAGQGDSGRNHAGSSPSGLPLSGSRLTTRNGHGSSKNDEQENDIVLPYREYGYRSEPFTWDELVQVIDKEKNLAKLSRSVEQEKEYKIATQAIKRQWKSVYDHILHSKFGFQKRVVENDGGQGPVLWETYPPLSEIKEPRKVLVLNDFPYYNAPGIFHYVLWKIGGDVSDQEIEEAREDLCSRLGDVQDMLHWKNPPHLKSLPDIDHIHILCRRASPQSNNTVI